MENDEVAAASESLVEIDECSIKIEQQIEQNTEQTEKYFDFNLEVNDFLETESSKPLVVKLNKQQAVNTKPQVFMLHSYNSIVAGRNLVPKYRPIRPKPCIGGDKFGKSKNKLVELSPALNVSAPIRSNRVIVNGNVAGTHDKNSTRGTPNKTSTRGTHNRNSTHGTPDKNNTHGIPDKNSTHGIPDKNSTYRTPDKNSTHGTHDKNGIHGIHDKNRVLRKNKSKATIELFFESMALSVLKLPAEIQAEVKMEICKLVTRAEIKHYGSQRK